MDRPARLVDKAAPEVVAAALAPRNNDPSYRADIDGLRAVAVLAVVGFHAGIKSFGSGFAGVDVFFVISGYLITGIILRQLDAGRFSFADFYARRINRILPALIVILAAVLVVGWVVLFPGEYENLGKHVAAGATFTSNFALWGESGYFDSPDKPLLHLWSLGVEEQFYLLWPLLIWIAWRKRPAVRATVLILAVASFGFDIWMIQTGRGIGAFYSPLTRFWEIMTGAFLADVESRRVLSRQPASDNPVFANGLSLVGLALLVVALLVTTDATSWPMWREILPVAGTAALIASGSSTLLGRRVLSNRALVFVGLISYPLYLWHWPLMTFAKIVNGGPLSGRGMSVVVLTALILAIATYRIIEIPIRFGGRKRRSALILLPVLCALGITGFAAQRKNLQPRVNGAQAELIQGATQDWTYPGTRGQSPAGKELFIHRIPGDTARRVVVIGDSHAEQYWPKMVELVEHESGGNGPEVLFITYGGCSAFPNTEREGIALDGRPFNCPDFYKRALAEVERVNAKAVVFAFWWEASLGTNRYLMRGGDRVLIGKADSAAKAAFSMLGDVAADLEAKGRKVYLIASNPWDPAFDPRALLPGRLPFASRATRVLSVPRQLIDSNSAFANAELDAIAARTGAILIDPVASFCDSVKCPTVDSGGQPIYRDYNHMRASFARKNARYIDRVTADLN